MIGTVAYARTGTLSLYCANSSFSDLQLANVAIVLTRVATLTSTSG